MVIGARAEALIVLADGMFLDQHARARILAFTDYNRLPALFPNEEIAEADGLAEAGGLMAYGPSVPASLFERTANPTEFPIEPLTNFKLIINLKVARTLGLTIPSTLLAIADQVIE